jgi:hypothetical protein
VRFLRAKRFYSSVTIVGISEALLKHNYENLYLATDISTVWSLNRYSKLSFSRFTKYLLSKLQVSQV